MLRCIFLPSSKILIIASEQLFIMILPQSISNHRSIIKYKLLIKIYFILQILAQFENRQQLQIKGFDDQVFFVFVLINDQYFYQQKIIIKMQKASYHRVLVNDKENDFKKGNKNLQGKSSFFKPWNNDKLYRSVSSSIQLRPTFLKKKNISNTTQFCQLYSDEVSKQENNPSTASRFLANHEIDGFLRSKMADWMIEVTSSYKFTNKTYFDGIQLMDRYFESQSQSLPATKLHIVGVVCMLIASKMNEVYPLKIKTAYEKIGHRKLPLQELISIEQNIMEQLDHKLNSWTVFDIAMLRISNYLAAEELRTDTDSYYSTNLASKQSEERVKKIEQLCRFVCSQVLFDYEFVCENAMVLQAEACVKAVFDILDIQTNLAGLFTSSPISLELTKQKVFKIMKNFKVNYSNLNNIFKFTPENTLAQVAFYSKN